MGDEGGKMKHIDLHPVRSKESSENSQGNDWLTSFPVR